MKLRLLIEAEQPIRRDATKRARFESLFFSLTEPLTDGPGDCAINQKLGVLGALSSPVGTAPGSLHLPQLPMPCANPNLVALLRRWTAAAEEANHSS